MTIYKSNVEITTDKGVISANETITDIKKYFDDEEEIQSLVDAKYLKKIIMEEITSDEEKSTPAKVVIVFLDDMSADEALAYAKEIGIDTATFETEDDAYEAILDFDYSTMDGKPLKKYAQVLNADIKGKTKKDEFSAAIKVVLDALENTEEDKE